MQQELPFYRSKTFHRKKIMVMFTAVFLALLFLMGRLVYLMVFCSEYYGQKAQNLHERERDIKAARGKILDANGMVLATNKSVCTISVMDTVLYFEGDKMLPYRILRAAKNRYGSTNELGMFDMTGTGLAEIENPSQMLLEGRPLGVSGNCVACTMEGSRPILSEIQALATKTNFPAPRRACSGYDYNRMNLLIAVLEKRAGYFFGNLDVYVNIVGGIALRDTACDLAVCLSMVSSLLDRPVSDKLIAIGEVGLGGEVRSVPNLEQRLHEAERIGFERAVIPKHSLAHLNAADYPGMKLVGAAYIADAINALKNDRL